ncbi:bifunctional ADP-dependent (S)-NAD(P)H-hydrate dehydratase/NAD(P)H-hydrate epimerase [Tardibacter chloracetimidivorans]|uniref:Bifunctional NAD(P)H-hydrate repair enzyme n=1 Tax=Tardibacter chloracetimidivorans TaxID=1921510 RepID=A0A1L3ZTP0_9SPHN|nr:bifunctional ADP-dependent NAD(P)H-hydrate dehydratase/NAD(P)H-hydrate epimerase [Tardibacter chloracetimidivorans]API58988.1 bifunctional ADP-dependent (S)-NAD(P)H-hydrate dehydratase/NAD(P)H-hydrate epimerase [Tardibacter chloracetimidivorans]
MTSIVLEQAVATADEMRRADAAAIAAGTPGEALMDRAGRAAASAIAAFTGPDHVLVLCGPGNNGGDGYVIARELAERGWPVTVGQLAPPSSREAVAAAAACPAPVEPLASVQPAPVLVDALFGTGMKRKLKPQVAGRLADLMGAANARIAIDLPSGVGTDDGALLGASLPFDMTIALAALKPAHLLYPAAGLCGRIVTADIGIPVETRCWRITKPRLSAPTFADHKYTRGFALVVEGAMPGAAMLAARGAQAAGAGYVVVAGTGAAPGGPDSVIQRQTDELELEQLLEDGRIGAVVVGPGLGRDREASVRLDAALSGPGCPLVLDADALVLLGASAIPVARRLHGRAAVLTPHEGEFVRLFGAQTGSRVDRARKAAATAQAVVVLKGPDTIVAAPDGRAAISGSPSFWLSTAGTGDVLSGVIAAMLARGLEPFEAACAGVWLHGEAARLAGPLINADALVPALNRTLADTACSN